MVTLMTANLGTTVAGGVQGPCCCEQQQDVYLLASAGDSHRWGFLQAKGGPYPTFLPEHSPAQAVAHHRGEGGAGKWLELAYGREHLATAALG